jgi:hypothetical protein
MHHRASTTNAGDENFGEPRGVPLFRRRAIVVVPQLSHHCLPLSLYRVGPIGTASAPTRRKEPDRAHMSVTHNTDALDPRGSHRDSSLPSPFLCGLCPRELEREEASPWHSATLGA